MVEAPGYCPPGPRCLFHPTFYRHSRLPGPTQIGNYPLNLKDRGARPALVKIDESTGNEAPSADMRSSGHTILRGSKHMKRLAFAIGGAAVLSLGLALGACSGSNQDAVNNAEVNQPSAEDLNQLSTDAANDAANAEAAALGNQQAELNAATDNTTNPTDEQEQNVSGM